MSYGSFAGSFPEANIDDVLATLDQYIAGEPNRVHLAILKVSDGNLDKLRENTAIASQDYRDIICPAEYPQFWKIGLSATSKLPPEERLQIQKNDWQQYQDWLYAG